MNIVMLNIKLLIFLLLSASALSAQERLEVDAIAQINAPGAVQLRWAPVNQSSWTNGITHGYFVTRMISIDDQGNSLGVADRLLSKVNIDTLLLPLPEADWEQMADQDEMAGVAAGAIYGEAFEVIPVDTNDISSIYAVNKETEDRYGFSLMAADHSFDIAQAMGVGLVDTSALVGFTYIYIIGFVNPSSEAEVKNTVVEIKIEAPVLPPAPIDLQLIPGDASMQLTWKMETEENYYSTFLVERSSDNGQTFNAAHEKPLMFDRSGSLIFVDSLANNNDQYTYRVTGVTPFGTLGTPSTTQSAQGKAKPIDASAEISSTEELTTGEVKIDWTFPVNMENEITGFWIERGDNRNGIALTLNTTLLDRSQRSFTDTNPIASNYYKIIAEDNNGNLIPSYAYLHQCKDETPPHQPAGISGTCSTYGLITLTWDDNTDTDLQGYRVYFSNQENGHYAQVTKTWLREPIFYYTANMDNLAEEIYFKVVALDRRENVSDFSLPALVQKPDVHPPSPPAIEKIEAVGAGIFIKWITSKTADVVEHQLQRKTAYESTWTNLLSFPDGSDPKEHLDDAATENVDYTYRLLAIDDADLQASSRLYTLRPITKMIIDGVTNLQASYSGSLNRVYLNWNYPLDPKLHSFLIYRSAEDGTPYFYATVPFDRDEVTVNADETSGALEGHYLFKDLDVKLHPRLRYWVKAKYVNGAESEMGGMVEVVK